MDYSDIVALLVFEHQIHIMNLFTRIGWETRYALYHRATNNGQDATSPGNPSDPKGEDLRDGIQELVDYMLFFNEARWPIRSAAQFLQLLSLADTRFV